MTTQSKKMRDGKVFHVNGNDQNGLQRSGVMGCEAHGREAEGPQTVRTDPHAHQHVRASRHSWPPRWHQR